MKLLMENWRGYLLTESYILDEDFFEASIQQLFDKLKAFGNNTWIFFDTETTGFKPEGAQLTEIGAISAKPDNWQFREVEAKQGIFYDKIKLNPETLAGFETSEDPEAKFPLELTRYGMPSDEYREKYPKIAFVGHPKAGGMALTLTASPTELFYSNSFDGEARMQAEDRFHRAGMDTNRGATIIDLILLPTDLLVLKNLQKKKRLQDVSMGELQTVFGATEEDKELIDV